MELIEYPDWEKTVLAAAMIALGLVFCTVIPPVPPELDAGVVMQPVKTKERSREM